VTAATIGAGKRFDLHAFAKLRFNDGVGVYAGQTGRKQSMIRYAGRMRVLHAQPADLIDAHGMLAIRQRSAAP